MKSPRNPSTPFASLQNKLLALYTDARNRFQRVHINRKRLGRGRRVPAKRVVQTNQIGRDPIVLHLDLNYFSALMGSARLGRVIRVESECAIATTQFGRAPSAKS